LTFRRLPISQNTGVQVRFLLGPAGSGKTNRCLREIREQLSAAPEGIPLVLVAPKQTTYELERLLLSEPSVQGYTRLQVLSFDRLADLVLAQLGTALPDLLSEDGRVMVLRALLARKRKDLRLFRASARLTGFAQELSSAISEFQQSRLAPEQLRELADRMSHQTLALKLQDLAGLMQQYLEWLHAHGLQDRERLLELAAESLNEQSAIYSPQSTVQSPQSVEHRQLSFKFAASGSNDQSAVHSPQSAVHSRFKISLYVDGFAELAGTETALLAALLPFCVQATITFCLAEPAKVTESWLSDWSVARKALESCRKRLAAVPAAELSVEYLPRDPQSSRFAGSQVLQDLEKHWAGGEGAGQVQSGIPVLSVAGAKQAVPMREGLRLVQCADPEAEVTFAAREISKFVRHGGRYRQIAVLVRNLETYHALFQRVFSRYEIPFFLDRRQSVGHHPLAELTRSALRTVALGWQHEDWFAALKTGLVPAAEEQIDRLENEALARGWHGTLWQKPLRIHELGRTQQDKDRLLRLETELERLRQRLVPPFQRFALALKQADNKPTGRQLTASILKLWAALRVPEQLAAWVLLPQANSRAELSGALHDTVWNEINGWLENIELAFSDDPLPLREWLPILEAGLANLTVGLIPPALDQVLLGTVDRSRNPDIKLGIVLGMNETVFPAVPAAALLLTSADRAELERHGVGVGLSSRQQLSRERYYAYIACTRPRDLFQADVGIRDLQSAVLNPSPFLLRIRQLLPALQVDVAPETWDLADCEHPHELFAAARGLQIVSSSKSQVQSLGFGAGLASLPRIAALLERLNGFCSPTPEERLSPPVAQQLYTPLLRTSVSRLEQFAACPFKFFVHSGLRGEERKLFELDAREQGSFQHDVLALFHQQLQNQHKRWRDITPAEARTRVAAAVAALIAGYREGLLQATEQTRFLARAMTESLQDFAEILVGWMRQQYLFDPVLVELPFGENEAQPAWTIDVGGGHQVQVYGRIDRVDFFRPPGTDETLCVVIDYKSSQKQLDPVLLANGLQLQLLTYLNVLRDWPHPQEFFGVPRLVPAGVFYVNLRGKYSFAANRTDALKEPDQGRKLAYRHAGRLDLAALPYLDSRTGARKGDQFNVRVLEDGRIDRRCRDPLATADFLRLLDSVKLRLVEMGREIYSGTAALAPYRRGSTTACAQCGYQWICRIDPWTQRFRQLAQKPSETNGQATAPTSGSGDTNFLDDDENGTAK